MDTVSRHRSHASTPAAKLYPPDTLVLREVGLRDGLQLVRHHPSTERKIEWLQAEYAAGVRLFEVGSFLPPQRFPQFADVRDLIKATQAMPGARAAALVLNERGAQDAFDSGVDEIVFVVSATEAHSQANMRRSQSDAIALLRELAATHSPDTAGAPVLTTGIAMAFGCSLAGDVPHDVVAALAEQCAKAGANVIALADTVGYALPTDVRALVSRVQDRLGDWPLGLHLHDTRGMAVANAMAALDAGIRILDGSLGGLGGCPFAPGATGNIVFEDLVFLCQSVGYQTSIDLRALLEVRQWLSTQLVDEPLTGALAAAGLPKTHNWQAPAMAGGLVR